MYKVTGTLSWGGGSTLISFAEKAQLWKWDFWGPDAEREMIMPEQSNRGEICEQHIQKPEAGKDLVHLNIKESSAAGSQSYISIK